MGQNLLKLFAIRVLINVIFTGNQDGVHGTICPTEDTISQKQTTAFTGTEDCPETPHLQIRTMCEDVTNITEEVGLGYPVIYVRTVTNITMTCSARNPVTIDILRLMPQPVDYMIYHRATRNFSDSSTYCYRVKIRLRTFHTTTGKYICKEISNPQSASTIYILADGNIQGGLILNSGDVTPATASDSGWVDFPCIATNLNITPELYVYTDYARGINERVPRKKYQYMPTVGFRMSFEVVQSQKNRRYFCKLEPYGVKQFVVGAKSTSKGIMTFLRVSPKTSELKIVDEAESIEQLTCESNNPIYFFTNYAVGASTSAPVSEVINSFYKYRLTWKRIYVAITMIAKFGIECRLNLTNLPLHTWTFQRDTFENRTGIVFLEDSMTPRIICRARNNTIPAISFIECDNPINCLMARSFSHLANSAVWIKDDPFKNKPGYTCPERQEVLNDAVGMNCAVIPFEEIKRDGLVACKYTMKDTDETEEDYSIFISGFTKKLVKCLCFEKPGLLNKKDILQINLNKANQALPVNENVYFECKASSFIFATGIQLRFLLTNNSFIARDNPSVHVWYSREREENGVITFNVTATMASPDISKVYCFAPYWNTAGWANVSKELHVTNQESVDSSVFTFNKDDKNKSIECGDWGSSDMVIVWFKDGKELLEREELFVFADERQTILFPEVKDYHNGTYLCTRKNSTGIWSKTIQVKVASGEATAGDLPLILIGSIAAAVIATLVCLFFLILRKQREEIQQLILTEHDIHEFHYGNETLAQKYVELHENARYLPYQQEFEIPSHKLEIYSESLLGAGAFGVVSRGHLFKNGVKIPVAVKSTRNTTDIPSLKNLLSEIKIMMFIGEHPNIIRLLGAVTKDLREGKLQVVVEFCMFGSLQEFLRLNRPTFIDQVVNGILDHRIGSGSRPSSIQTSMEESSRVFLNMIPAKENRKSNPRWSKTLAIRTMDLVKWSYQTANGMEYFQVIHGDLATRNLLLNSSYIIKITDFGLSRHLYEYTNYIKKSKEEPVPWRWLSTEAIRDSKFSSETDIWAFGITLWEMYTLAEVPYQGFSWGEEFVRELYGGYRLQQPQYATSSIYSLMRQCWEMDPMQRPSFTTLKEEFHSIFSKTKGKGSVRRQ